MLDRFTNYRSRYGYPAWEAFVAEVWWRLEHIRWSRLGEDDDEGSIWNRIRVFAYPKRKAWERRGIAKRIGAPGR